MPDLLELSQLAKQYGIGLTIDAEESDRLELSLTVFEALADHVAATAPHWQRRSRPPSSSDMTSMKLWVCVYGITSLLRLMGD